MLQHLRGKENFRNWNVQSDMWVNGSGSQSSDPFKWPHQTDRLSGKQVGMVQLHRTALGSTELGDFTSSYPVGVQKVECVPGFKQLWLLILWKPQHCNLWRISPPLRLHFKRTGGYPESKLPILCVTGSTLGMQRQLCELSLSPESAADCNIILTCLSQSFFLMFYFSDPDTFFPSFSLIYLRRTTVTH